MIKIEKNTLRFIRNMDVYVSFVFGCMVEKASVMMYGMDCKECVEIFARLKYDLACLGEDVENTVNGIDSLNEMVKLYGGIYLKHYASVKHTAEGHEVVKERVQDMIKYADKAYTREEVLKKMGVSDDKYS